MSPANPPTQAPTVAVASCRPPRPRPSCVRRYWAGLAAVFAAVALRAAVVDDFAVNQAPLATGAAAVAGAGVLGGERELRLAPGGGTRALAVNLGQFVASHDAGATGNLVAVWDGSGDDAATTQAAGLGSKDLTAGGNNAFLLGIDSAERAFDLILTVHVAGVAFSETITVPAATASSAIRVPFANFGGANFTQVGAVELAIVPAAQANTVDLDYLTTTSTTDPLPLVARLTDVVLVDADGDGRASAGDTLRYVLTVKNTNTVAGTGDLAGVKVTLPSVVDGSAPTGLGVSPVARADAPAATSVPGDSFHAAYEASSFTVGNLLGNDYRGVGSATVTTFGGGGLGGGVAGPAGSQVSGNGHTLQVNADGTYTYTAATGFVGYFTFDYTISNTAGSSTALATIAVGVRPNAVADTYAVTGNTAISTALIGAAARVSVNDAGTNTTLALAAAPAGGTVAFAPATGHFDYTPNAGYTGNDTFTYTVTNGLGSATGTVTLTVADQVWYIDGNAAAGGDGRSTSPFKTIAAFNANNDGIAIHPGDGDSILLRQAAYTDGIVLRTGQKLLGDGTSGTLAAALGFTLAPGSAKTIGAAPVAVPGFTGIAPTITTTAGHGVTLASGNTVRGLGVGNTGGFGFYGTAVGVSPVVTTISECGKTGTGQAVSLANGNLAVTLRSASSNSPTGGTNGIVLTNTTGTFAVTGTGTAGSGGTIQNATGAGISLTNAAGVSLAGMTIQNNQGSGISCTSVNGLALSGCTLANNGDVGTTNGTEANLWASNLTGTVTIADTTITGAYDANVRLAATTGELTLALTNTKVQDSKNTLNGHGFLWMGTGTAKATITATTCTFSGNPGNAFCVNNVDTTTARATVSACMFADNGTGPLFQTGGSATQIFWVKDCASILRSKGVAIGVLADSTSTAGCRIDGTIEQNAIGTGVLDSGSVDNYGIALDLRAAQSARIAILNNNVRNTDRAAFWASAASFNSPQVGGTLDLTLTGNTFGTPDDNGATPYTFAYTSLVESRHLSTLTANISGNSILTGVGGAEALRVRQRDTSTFRLAGLPGPVTYPTVDPVKTALATQNPSMPFLLFDVTVATQFVPAPPATPATPVTP